MQLDFFSGEAELAPPPALQLLEHECSDYGPRTGDNARGADVTVAFAVDFDTAGERLTRRVAGPRYIGIPYGCDVVQAATQLIRFMGNREAKSLNVAGNGLYTLDAQDITQADANQWVFDVLRRVHQQRPLSFIRSGGQTGIDTAGLVAGIALGVPVLGLYPRGYRQRLVNKQDVLGTPEQLEADLRQAAALLTD